MDSLPQNVMQPLELLIYVSLVLVIITGIFLIKLLLDASNLLNSLQDFVKVTQAELEPAIREINGTLTNINRLSSRINNQIDNIGSRLERGGRVLSDSSLKAYERFKVAGAKAKDSLMAAAKVFFK